MKACLDHHGGQNHAIILPHASVDVPINAFGAFGQWWMALTTLVFVGNLK